MSKHGLDDLKGLDLCLKLIDENIKIQSSSFYLEAYDQLKTQIENIIIEIIEQDND